MFLHIKHFGEELKRYVAQYEDRADVPDNERSVDYP